MSGAGGLLRTNEEALLERARAGDEGAFESLVDRYSGELKVHCYRIVGSVQDRAAGPGGISGRPSRLIRQG